MESCCPETEFSPFTPVGEKVPEGRMRASRADGATNVLIQVRGFPLTLILSPKRGRRDQASMAPLAYTTQRRPSACPELTNDKTWNQ
jgi:hypothetical protein